MKNEAEKQGFQRWRKKFWATKQNKWAKPTVNEEMKQHENRSCIFNNENEMGNEVQKRSFRRWRKKFWGIKRNKWAWLRMKQWMKECENLNCIFTHSQNDTFFTQFSLRKITSMKKEKYQDVSLVTYNLKKTKSYFSKMLFLPVEDATSLVQRSVQKQVSEQRKKMSGKRTEGKKGHKTKDGK